MIQKWWKSIQLHTSLLEAKKSMLHWLRNEERRTICMYLLLSLFLCMYAVLFVVFYRLLSKIDGGWSGGAKVLCILHHWGVQLILAYSWARPAILVVGKGRGGMFLFLLFLHFHSCSSFFPVPLFHLLYSLSSISFLPFSGRRHKMTLKGWRVVKPQHNQKSIKIKIDEFGKESHCSLLLWRF